MPDYPSYQLQRESYEEWREYLTRFPWEWSATLTFEDRVKFFTAHRFFRRWWLQLASVERIQVGAYVLSSYRRGQIHLHALLFGRNRRGKTLLDCSVRKWEARWRGISRIKTVDSNYGACDYVALHFMGFKSDRAQIDSYNRSLLRRMIRPPWDGLQGLDGLIIGIPCMEVRDEEGV